MPRVRCRYLDCIFLDEGYCSAAAIEIDPDSGCATYAPNEELDEEGDVWEDEELEEWEDEEMEEEEEETWDDEEEF